MSEAATRHLWGGQQTEEATHRLPEAPDRFRRRVARFRRSGLMDGPPEGVTIVRATSAEDLKAAYSLVHDVYLERGYIREGQDRIRVRVFEALPEMATFIAKKDGEIIAVTSLIQDTLDLGLPSDRAFWGELNELRDSYHLVGEITNLAVRQDFRNSTVFLELTRVCFAHAMELGLNDLFIAISPEHAKFFEGVLLFTEFGGRRNYGAEVDDMVVGMRLAIDGLREHAAECDRILGEHAFLERFFYSGNPYTQDVRTWEIQARAFLDVELLRELFLHTSGLLFQCSDAELDAIALRWGSRRFNMVWGETAPTDRHIA